MGADLAVEGLCEGRQDKERVKRRNEAGKAGNEIGLYSVFWSERERGDRWEGENGK